MLAFNALVSISLFTGTAFCQSALLREGDPSPNGVAGQTLTGISTANVNEGEGYACTYSSAGPTGTVQGVWGNLSGGPGALLREEVAVGPFTQTSLEGFFGINATAICYSALSDQAGGSTGLDGVWLDDTVVAIEEQPVPGTTNFFSFGSRPTLTESGVPYFVGGFTDTVGGATQGRSLFRDTTPLISSFDSVPGFPGTISAGGIGFDYRVSSAGTNFITEVTLDNGDFAMVINGAGLTMGGSDVREGVTIPFYVGGKCDDEWSSFDFLGITEAGDYMFTGDTTASPNFDEVIVRSGAIWAREGETIDGEVVRGAIESAVLTENDMIAYIWDIESGASTVEALFFERTLLLQEGDAVDWDGDGVLDPAVTIDQFTGINPIAMSPAGIIYFTADVNVDGDVREGLFEIETGFSGSTIYCMSTANSTGMTATITASGSNEVAANDLSLTCVDMPPFVFGFFFVSQSRGFVMNPGSCEGNVCISGSIGRFQNLIQSSGSSGTNSIPVDLAAMPQPSGPVPVLPGDTWNFQTWFRDSIPPGIASCNFSNGLEIVFL